MSADMSVTTKTNCRSHNWYWLSDVLDNLIGAHAIFFLTTLVCVVSEDVHHPPGLFSLARFSRKHDGYR
jgi:hypothetical protein